MPGIKNKQNLEKFVDKILNPFCRDDAWENIATFTNMIMEENCNFSNMKDK